VSLAKYKNYTLELQQNLHGEMVINQNSPLTVIPNMQKDIVYVV
jgi:hypothetical protein